uniref:Regulator of G protein signaling like 1 n=1 Tax=Propithecus coquereli TaxID=379532 RepID=A0A2K6F9Y8_PROCO
MSNAEIIGSTNLIILLEDEIFADFFNTFLSLPVFGQTPFYTVENSQWSLWPEIPYDLVAKYKGLLTWLEKYRLPFFCKTNLCFHYILCQEFISFIKSPEGGEELVDFWILAEKILSIDEMDLEVRDYYLSLLLVLKATHLQEGSRVVTLCNMNIKSLLNLSIWHPNQSTTRRETLSHMQKVALFKLQSYWLPNFYTHAKMAMAKEEACHGLMQEYETRLCSICCTHAGGLPLNMTIKKYHHFQKRYSSSKAKRKMWQLIDSGSWSLDMDFEPDTNTMAPQEMCPQEKVVIQVPSLKVPSSKERIISPLGKDSHHARKSGMKKKAKSHLHMEGLFETKFSTHLRTVTPIINYSSHLTMKKVISQNLSIGYTYWALCADAYAGNPFRNHLKQLDLKVEIQLLDLWQDLHHFLSVLMNNRKNGDAIFRHMLGNRICELYLNEQIGPCLPLKSQIIQGLKEQLPSGNVNPWIPKAQKEICKMLSPWYDEFLNEEDYWFLLFTTQHRLISAKWHKRDSISKEENIVLYKRVQKSLELSQALASMEEMDSMQWQKIATEDLKQGGSLQVELSSPVFLVDVSKMSFEELCYKNPKMAIEKISDDYKTYCEKLPQIDFTVQYIKEPKIHVPSERKLSFSRKTGLRKPSIRPRNLTEVLLNTQHLEYFREFLKERKAESPLQFLIATHKICVETNEKTYKSLMENVIKTFFRGKLSPDFATSPSNTPGRSVSTSTNVRSAEQENGDITLIKRRIFGHKIIAVNFAVNDLYFFSEMEKFNELVSSAHMLQVNRTYNENDVVLMRSKINVIIKLYLHSDIPPKLRVNISESQKDAILAAIAEGHLDRSIFHGAIMTIFPIVMYFWKRFCSWKATRSYLQYRGKKFKEKKSPPKTTYKYPHLSGGDQATLRFTLLRGVEWLWPQQREGGTSPAPNSSSSNLTQPRLVLSTMQLYPVQGQKVPTTKKEKK